MLSNKELLDILDMDSASRDVVPPSDVSGLPIVLEVMRLVLLLPRELTTEDSSRDNDRSIRDGVSGLEVTSSLP